MADTTTAANAAEIHPAFGSCLTDIVQGLFARAEPHLSNEDLSRLGNGSSGAQALLGNLSTLCEGLASLICADEHSGALQTRTEITDMLYALAGMTDHARALLAVAGEADMVLSLRRGPYAAAYAAGVESAA